MKTPHRLAAAAAIALGSVAGGALVMISAAGVLEAGIRTPDSVVSIGIHGVGLVVLAWYLLTAVVAAVCLVTRAAGRAWVRAERGLGSMGAPLARRLLLTGASAVVAAGAVLAPASATTVEPNPSPSLSVLGDDLGWGAGDESQTPTDGPAASPTPAPTSAPTEDPTSVPTEAPVDTTPATEPTSPALLPAGEPTATPTVQPTEVPQQDEVPTDSDAVTTPVATEDTPQTSPKPGTSPSTAPSDSSQPSEPGASDESTYTVAEGDSLWAIAAAHLPGDPRAADVAAAWPAWYQANASVIGNDPNLIQPGQVLVAPDHNTQEES